MTIENNENSNGMKIVTVIPLKRGIFRENLTYFTTKVLENGSVVSVSVRNKKILGLAVSVEDANNIKSDIKNLQFNLKKIIEVKEQSIFLKEFIDSVFLTGKYFISKNNNAMTSLIPAIIREEYDKISKFVIDGKASIPSKETKNIKAEKLLFQAPFDERISYYKTLIRGSFAQKKSIFIVLPTEKDIEEFSILLEKGIENFTISIHGGFSPKKQIKKIEQIITSSHPLLIIGTAPYLSIPRNDLETIIVEHENSNAYKMFARPHFDLRTYVEIFASKIYAKLILGDFLLRYETLARKDLDNFGEIHTLTYRTKFNGKIITSGKEEKFKILTDISVKEIENSISKKENVFIFSLRRGLATITICRDCNEVVYCEKCSAPLVLYISRDGKKRMFSCNRCKEEKNIENTCSKCGSWNLMPLGIGTDTVFHEIKKIFPGINIFKLDKESAKTNSGAEKIIQEFEESRGSILIGTEMTFFYLKKKVPLSLIASFDSLWSIPNFRMSERITQLLISILSKTERQLVIQTKNENDQAIVSTINENLLSFIREELEDRKILGYPPYMRFIKITFLGDKEKSIIAKETLKTLLSEYNPEIFSGFISKEKGKYSTNALIRLEPKKWSLPELSINSSLDKNLFDKLISLPFPFSITIDPEDLL
jgi:primosomal protein N' (replication factor Y)